MLKDSGELPKMSQRTELKPKGKEKTETAEECFELCSKKKNKFKACEYWDLPKKCWMSTDKNLEKGDGTKVAVCWIC